MCGSSNGSPLAVAEHHRPAERPTPFVYISTLLSWLLVSHLAQTDGDPLFPVTQHTLSSAYPVAMLTNRTSIVSPLPPFPFLVAVAKLSASFSQKWYPARRHAPLKSEACLAARGPFTGKAFANAVAISGVCTYQRFSLNCHRVQRL